MISYRQSITRVILFVLFAWANAAHSLIVLDSRTSTYDITGLNGNFAGALAGYGILVTGRAEAAPISQAVQFSTKSQAVGVTVGSGGVIESSFTVQNATLTNIQLTANALGAGTVNAGYATGASNNFANSWIVRGSEPGYSTLQFIGGGSGFVPNPLDAGDGVDRVAFFDVFISLQGDWSSPGTGAGQLEFLGIDPVWNIDQFFVFDGTETHFHAFNAQYTEDDYAAGRSPNVNFILRLAAVPEPGSAGILLLGLAALGLMCRHKLSPSPPGRRVGKGGC